MASGIGIDEQADAHAARFQIRHDRRKAGRIRTGRPSCLARDFAGQHRHERALIGPHSLNELDEIGPRIAFDIEFDSRPLAFQRLHDVVHVLRLDVPLIGARMNGDALNAGSKTHGHRVEHARLVAAAGIAQGRDFVDVDGETDHGKTSIG